MFVMENVEWLRTFEAARKCLKVKKWLLVASP